MSDDTIQIDAVKKCYYTNIINTQKIQLLACRNVRGLIIQSIAKHKHLIRTVSILKFIHRFCYQHVNTIQLGFNSTLNTDSFIYGKTLNSTNKAS